MTRAIGSLRADAFALLDELGTNGTMTVLASACREEIKRANDEGRGVAVLVWGKRLRQIEAMSSTLSGNVFN